MNMKSPLGLNLGQKRSNSRTQNELNFKYGTQLFNKAGQESFKSITRAYYRAAAVAMLVYDVTSKDSFDSISNWMEECKIHGNPEITLILIGNKIDLTSQRKVSYEEGETYAKKYGMMFIETSAKTDQRVAESFVKSAGIVSKKIQNGTIDVRNEMYGVKIGPVYKSSEGSFLKNATSEKKKKADCC